MSCNLCWLARTPEDTAHIGRRIGKCLKPGDTVILDGELGAGKTTLTKGIAEALGLDETGISSPSFAILHEYSLPYGNGRFIHADLYRIDDGAEIAETGLEEYIRAGNNIVVVEWGNILYDVLNGDFMQILISYDTPDSSRKFRFIFDRKRYGHFQDIIEGIEKNE